MAQSETGRKEPRAEVHAVVTTEDLILPPLFRAEAVAEPPFAAAIGRAAEAGAGALFWRLAPGSLGLAVVLEPEVPLAAARGAFPVAVAALLDALVAHCPPERAVAVRWPGEIVYDAGRIGGARLAWPEGAAEDAVPDWLVFGAELIADRDDLAEPGRYPGSTSLKEEDFDAPAAILESFARHLMLHLDGWRARGYAAAVEGYLRRLEGPPAGARVRIAGTGDLVVRAADGREARQALVPALAAADWWDDGAGRVRR